MQRMEVLSPAGDMEKLIMAVEYGADAVYLAGNTFGMRAGTANFSDEQLPEAVRYAHAHGVRVHVTCNTVPTEEEIRKLPEFLEKVNDSGADAFIVADLGVMNSIKKYAPRMDIHISTQAGVMNSNTALAFYDLGAKRVVLAREATLDSVREMRKKLPEDLEIEAFCHGAMCVSFSGRCTLSNYLTGRDANRGQCAQPCRWKYHLMEEKNPGEFFEIGEDNGTYILNSRDMCMIDHISEMAEAGINSIKIEGRTKSAYYVAAATAAYRHAADAASAGVSIAPEWREEVNKISHRPYSTGFYYGYPGQFTDSSQYIADCELVAMVEACDEEGNAVISQRNRFFTGEEVELLSPEKTGIKFTLGEMKNGVGETVEVAPHPKEELHVKLPVCVPKYTFVRRTTKLDRKGVM